jgi:hypothetical protein
MKSFVIEVPPVERPGADALDKNSVGLADAFNSIYPGTRDVFLHRGASTSGSSSIHRRQAEQ